MTLDTATMTRLIDSGTAITDTVAVRPPEGTTGPNNVLIWVARAEMTDTFSELVGTYQRVSGAPSRHGWLTDSGPTARLFGALINPTPVNDRHYRVIGGYVVRYNDDDHTGDRHNPAHPFSIVGGTGTEPWPFPNDSTPGIEDAPYVEIEWEVATGRQDSMPLPADAVDNGTAGPIYGLGQPGPDGTVARDPERVPGRQYLIWDEVSPGVLSVATFIGPADPEHRMSGFHHEGYYGGSRETPIYSTTTRSVPTGPGVHWAELRLDAPAPGEEESLAARRTTLRGQLNTIASAKESFNEALNELATDKDWCGEYEEIVEPLGFEGRTRETEYEVTVSASFTLVDSNTSGSLDRAIGNEYGMSMEVSEVRVEATMSVTVTVTLNRGSDPDASDFRDHISTSDVEEAVDNALSGVSCEEVTDWSVTDWDEQ